MNYPALPKSYKGAYPFKLGTTSFIYPDHILPNVEMLAPYVDEIELLMFESAPESLPDRNVIRELYLLAAEFDLTFNVHLPIDISLTAADAATRRQAVEAIRKIMELTARLKPSTHTLHLPFDEERGDEKTLRRWRNQAFEGLHKLMASGTRAKTLSVETLNYPFEWVTPLLDEFNLAVCLDLGHLMLHGHDCRKAFATHAQKTPIMHLHGVRQSRDHLALDRLAATDTAAVMEILRRFRGVLSLEVFGYRHLLQSLRYLESCWNNPLPFKDPARA